MNKDARIGFAGTPEFAEAILEGMLAAGYKPVVVYTQPDRRSGRGRKLRPSPVKALAEAQGIPVETPRSLRKAPAQQTFQDFRLDLFIVAAYGLILPQAVLDMPTFGCLNVHASLLPRWRGAAPVERAIMAGDSETGVSLMQMDAGLDTGAVHSMVSTPITEDSTGASIEAELAELGVEALTELLPRLETSAPTAQNEALATYAKKLTREDSTIEWNASAVHIHRQVRALCERQPALCTVGDLRIQILACAPNADRANAPEAAPGTVIELSKRGLRIATGDGSLNITQVKLNRGQGKPLTAAGLRNSDAADLLPPGTQLSAPP